MHFWPPVTLRPIEELSPGEAFLLVDLPSPAVGFCAQEAAGGAMADGALLVLLNSSADGLPEFVWPHALQASSVLSFGAAVRFHFDPTSPRIRLAASGGSCEGCLIVRRSGVVLRVPQRRGGHAVGVARCRHLIRQDHRWRDGKWGCRDHGLGPAAVARRPWRADNCSVPVRSDNVSHVSAVVLAIGHRVP